MLNPLKQIRPQYQFQSFHPNLEMGNFIVQDQQSYFVQMASKKHQFEYKYPPDIEKCNTHRLATRIFKGLDKEQFAAECDCCQRRVGTKEETGECCYDNIKLAYIGPGIPLLFAFIKNSIILLIVLTGIFVSFAIYSNSKGTNCTSKGSCSDNVFDTLAIINKSSEEAYLSIQNYMLLGFVLISIFVYQYFRYVFRKVEDQCDDLITSPSDYALILRRLPEGTEQADIERMIDDRRKFLTPEQRQRTENLRVVSIIMSFSMSEYTKTKLANKEEFTKLLDQGKHEEFKAKQLPPLQKTASVAIIVFGRQQSKELFRYKPNIIQKLLQCIWTPCIPKSDFKVRGENVAVERAPEPDDIVWENTKISLKGAICRKTLYSLFSIILLLLGGMIQYGLAVAQVKASQDSQTQLLMSTASSISISIINAVIQIFLVFTSHKERNQTLTEYNTVLMVKISFFQFLNTGVFVVAANFLADPEHFSLSKGFVFEICQVMIMNALIPNISLFVLTYCEIIPKIKRCLIQRGTIKTSQLDANLVYQGPIIQLPYKYAYIFKTVWLTAFYAPLAPIVVPISVFGLILNYMIEKCLFGRTYSIPNTTSSMVNDSAIELMEYFSLILSFGEYIVYLYFLNFKAELLPLYWGVPIYISIVISGLNLLLPMDSLNNKLFKMPSDTFVYPPYEKVQDKFQVTYEMTNPGYVCKRKRKRDLAFVGKFFGGAVEMTQLFGLGNEQGDTKKELLGKQDPVYQNNNNGGANNNIPANNPLAGFFNLKSPQNGSGKPINFPIASPKNPVQMQQPQQLPPGMMGFPPNFSIPMNNVQQQQPTQNIGQQQNPLGKISPNQIILQNNNKPLTFNANNNSHSMISSITGGFPTMRSGYPVINQNSGYGNNMNGTNQLSGSIVSQPPMFMANPGFNAIPYYNPGVQQQGPLSGAINLAPQSERSYSSTKQIRKAIKMPGQNTNPMQ